MTFPVSKTNAIDKTTLISAAHLNNLENKVGIDNSTDANSLDYKLQHLSTIFVDFTEDTTPTSADLIITVGGEKVTIGNLSKALGWVDVRAYGAKGDGTTDDTAAIQAAITAMTSGVLFFPPGTYILGTITTGTGNDATFLTPKSNIAYVGCGKGITTLKVADGVGPTIKWNIFVTAAKLENCIFKDMTIDGNAANNLLPAGPLRSNRMISASLGGKDIEILNIEFTGCTGSNPVAFSATTNCGNIEIRDCKFTEMGSGITGNACSDHSSIYLLGSNNKVINCYFKSTLPVWPGAAWEIHGDKFEAYGNYVEGYSMSYYYAPSDNSLTRTKVHDNWFIDVYNGPGFSNVGALDFGIVDIYNNTFTLNALAEAAGSTYMFYGPDAATNIATEINLINNKFYGLALTGIIGIRPGFCNRAVLDGNYLELLARGIEFNTGDGLGDGYSNHELIITNNTLKNISGGVAVYGYYGAVEKLLVIENNKILSDVPIVGAGFNLNASPDMGIFKGNIVDPNYIYDFSFGSTMSKIYMDHQLGSSNYNELWNGYCAKGSRLYAGGALNSGMIYEKMDATIPHFRKVGYQAGLPITYTWTKGDIIWNSAPAAGGSPGWVCTTSGTFSAATDNTGDTDGTTAVITGMTDTSDFSIGDFVTVSAGFPTTGPYRILSKTATSIIIDVDSNSAQSNITVSTPDPVFKAMANLAS